MAQGRGHSAATAAGETFAATLPDGENRDRLLYVGDGDMNSTFTQPSQPTPLKGILGVVLVSIAASCQPNRQAPGRVWTESDTVGGVVTIVSHGEPPSWPLDTVQKLGGLSAPEEVEEFAQISAVLADGRGRLIVADVIRDEIILFSASGEYLRTIGRVGQGPGEYRNPEHLGIVGDTLAVSDRTNLRLGLFDIEGNWVGQWPLRPHMGDVFQTGDDEFWVLTTVSRESSLDHVFVRHSFSGPLDTVQARVTPQDSGEPKNWINCEYSDRSVWWFSVPFRPGAVRVPAPNGEVAESDPVGYRIVFTGTDGDTLRIVEYDTPDIRPSDSEWVEQEEGWRVFRDEHPGGKCDAGGPTRPDRKRLINDLFFDDLGRLWVERVQVGSSVEERFDIFDSDGGLVGKVVTPKRVETNWSARPFIRGGVVHLVSSDSLDVPLVYALRFTENR